MDQMDWKIRYVQHWAYLTDGQHDPHAPWDDAEEAFATHGKLDPEARAEATFDRSK